MIGVPSINESIKSYSCQNREWEHHPHLQILHQWAERFARHFRLEIGTPLLQIEPLHAKNNGSYRRRGGLGLCDHITINARWLEQPLAVQLVGLMRALLHQWQNQHGEPSPVRKHHNKELLRKAESLGLRFDRYGRLQSVCMTGPFAECLLQHGTDLASLTDPIAGRTAVEPLPKKQSWSCGCQTVKIVDLAVQCLRCGNTFRVVPSGRSRKNAGNHEDNVEEQLPPSATMQTSFQDKLKNVCIVADDFQEKVKTSATVQTKADMS